MLKVIIGRIWEDRGDLYGSRKIWHQLRREHVAVARATVERLMRTLGIAGVVRGRTPRTMIPSAVAERPLDLVKPRFEADAPNRLWGADITYVRCLTGFVHMAFVVDPFSRCTVGEVGVSYDNALAETINGLFKTEVIRRKKN